METLDQVAVLILRGRRLCLLDLESITQTLPDFVAEFGALVRMDRSGASMSTNPMVHETVSCCLGLLVPYRVGLGELTKTTLDCENVTILFHQRKWST